MSFDANLRALCMLFSVVVYVNTLGSLNEIMLGRCLVSSNMPESALSVYALVSPLFSVPMNYNWVA